MVLPCEGHSRPSDIPPSLTQASPWMAEGAARPSRWKARTSHRPIRPARQGRCQASGQEACPQDTGAPKTWGQASRAPETGPRGRGDTGACAESERTQWAAVGGEGGVHGPKPVGAAGRCAGAGQQRRPEEGLWDRCPARKGKAILAAGRGLQGKKSRRSPLGKPRWEREWPCPQGTQARVGHGHVEPPLPTWGSHSLLLESKRLPNNRLGGLPISLAPTSPTASRREVPSGR